MVVICRLSVISETESTPLSARVDSSTPNRSPLIWASEARGHFFQQFVSHMMAQRIVDILEVIEIDEHQGSRLLVPFELTVFADLVVAVNIGVILATLHFLRRMASSVEIRQATQQALSAEFTPQGITRLPPGVLVFTVEGPFFFGAVENLERALADTHTDPHVLIIRLRWMPFIDITGLQTLEEAIIALHERGVRVMLTGANDRVQEKLRRAGVVELVGPENCFNDLGTALLLCQEPIEHDPQMAQANAMMLSEAAESFLETCRDYFNPTAERRRKGEA